MKISTINGFYGSGRTKTKVFIAERNNYTWYVAKGGCVVNKTYEDLNEGVNIEELSDFDCFTWSKPINTEKQLLKAIES